MLGDILSQFTGRIERRGSRLSCLIDDAQHLGELKRSPPLNFGERSCPDKPPDRVVVLSLRLLVANVLRGLAHSARPCLQKDWSLFAPQRHPKHQRCKPPPKLRPPHAPPYRRATRLAPDTRARKNHYS
jgi:hypothetical protein